MPGLEALAAMAGTWTATYELRGDPSFDCDTPSTATVTPILGGRFVRIDYTWDEEDRLKSTGRSRAPSSSASRRIRRPERPR